MARYIDAEPMPCGRFWDECTDKEKAKILGWILSQPTVVDVVEVKHGKWVRFPNNGVWGVKCSNCHRLIPFGQTPETMSYCPHCGAKMDLEEE